jgi:hypothetical protein
MAINIAAQQQLAQPVSAFFEGRAIQRAEQEGSLRMRALENAEGRAASAETRAQEGHEIDKRVAEAKFDEIAGRKTLAGVKQVLALPKGQRKAFVEKNFPEFVQKLSEQEYGWDEVDEDEIEEMATGIAARASADLGLAPEKVEPLSPEGKVAADVKNKVLSPEQGAAALGPKNTTDFDNFLAAQKDPAFSKFLKDKRGKGLSMTLPDGTVISMGGEGGGVDAAELKSPVVTKLQESIVTATDEMDRLNSIGRGFDPQFLQVPGRLKGTALKVKDLAGGMLGDMTPQETEYLEKFSTFKAEGSKNLSAILNRLSGAAISPAEGERLKKGIPNDEDSPTEFVAKYRAAVKDTSRAIMRANWALKNGIGVKSVDQLSKVMPLGSIDQVYEDRANELWQELGGTKEAKAEAVKRANQEFGVAR